MKVGNPLVCQSRFTNYSPFTTHYSPLIIHHPIFFMSKTQKRWLIVTAIFQFLTFGLHSSSLFVSPTPQNDTEKQLIDLMTSYKMDMGAGFRPSMSNILTSFSISLSLLLLLGGWITVLLVRNKEASKIARQIMTAQAIIFLAGFATMWALTFIVPTVCVGLIAIGCIGSRLTLRS